jgi:hypothetical protein
MRKSDPNDWATLTAEPATIVARETDTGPLRECEACHHYREEVREVGVPAWDKHTGKSYGKVPMDVCRDCRERRESEVEW